MKGTRVRRRASHLAVAILDQSSAIGDVSVRSQVGSQQTGWTGCGNGVELCVWHASNQLGPLETRCSTQSVEGTYIESGEILVCDERKQRGGNEAVGKQPRAVHDRPCTLSGAQMERKREKRVCM